MRPAERSPATGARQAAAGHTAAAAPPPNALLPPLPSLLVNSAVTKPTKLVERDTLRLALPSKGRMAEDTMQLLKVRRPACTAGRLAG
jgi:hypothetical protein